jgi:hypothetical protein
MDTDSSSLSVRMGDPFLAAARYRRPCACIGGFGYLGHVVIGEDGVEVEHFERVSCERCNPAEERP